MGVHDLRLDQNFSVQRLNKDYMIGLNRIAFELGLIA